MVVCAAKVEAPPAISQGLARPLVRVVGLNRLPRDFQPELGLDRSGGDRWRIEARERLNDEGFDGRGYG